MAIWQVEPGHLYEVALRCTSTCTRPFWYRTWFLTGASVPAVGTTSDDFLRVATSGWLANMLAFIGSGVVFTDYTLREFHVVTGETGRTHAIASNVPSSALRQPLPGGAAVVVRFQTGYCGSRWRGRLYVSHFPREWVAGGRILASQMPLVSEYCAAIAFQTVKPRNAPGEAYAWHCLKRAAGDPWYEGPFDPVPVSGVRVDAVVRQMRKRNMV